MKFAFKINLSTYRVLVKKRGLTFESMRAKLFVGVDFSRINFADSDFADSNFADSNFADSNFTYSNFTDSNFARSNFAYSNFARSNFTYSNFARSNFAYSNFARSNFTYSNFTDSNFARSNFTDSNFADSNFAGASLNIVGIGIQLKIGRYRASLVGKYISVGCVTRRVKDAMKGSEADYANAHNEALQYRDAVQRAIKAAFAMKRAARLRVKQFSKEQAVNESEQAQIIAEIKARSTNRIRLYCNGNKDGTL